MTELTTTQNKQLTTTSRLELSQHLTKTIKSAEYDWNGQANFKDGEVVSFKNPSARDNWKLKQIPQDQLTVRDALKSKNGIDEFARPPTKHEFMEMFKSLTLHYYQEQRTVIEIKSMVRDYYEDIGYYPLVLLKDACQKIRRDSKQRFMPKSGDFIERMKLPYMKIKRMKRRVNQILGIEEKKEPTITELLKGL